MKTWSAPGKLLLFGEHAAVFGYPAVGVSLPLSLSIRCVPADRFSVVVPGTELPPPRAEAFHTHLAHVVRDTPDAALPPERCEIVSDLPIGGGFGSSAALCTALARRVLPAESGTETVWSLAHRLEHFFHGTPSGIDTGLSCREGAWAFRFTPPSGPVTAGVGARSAALPRAEAIALPAAVLVVGSIPREASTRELVGGVRSRYDTDPARYGEILRRLGELSDETARDASGGFSPFAARVNEAQEGLSALGVSSPLLDRMITAGRAAGAAAGKLSGAGGGGAFFLVCPDTTCAGNVQTALTALDDAPTVLFTVPLHR